MKKISGAWLLVALMPLVVSGIALDPTRIDAGNFATTWETFARERDGAPVALALYVTFALASLAAAAWLRRSSGGVGRVAAAGLACGAALAIVAACAGLVLLVLAAGSAAVADAANLRLARAIEPVRTLSLTAALVASAASLIGAGVAIQRRLPSTRWLYGLPLASGALLLCIPIGWETVGAATFFVPGAFLLMLWLVIVSAGGARRAA